MHYRRLILLTCVILCFLAKCIVSVEYDYDPNSISHINLQKLRNIIASGNEEVLIFFYSDFKECAECKKLMPKFHEAVEYLNKLEDGKVVSYKVAVKFPEYGVNTFPQMILFLKDVPFLYDAKGDTNSWEVDDILDWVEDAKQTPIQELTDETFEHLTQASTGATTGDWIILFADEKRPDCMKPYLPMLSTVGLRLRMRKNVGHFDIAANPVTHARFKDIMQTECAQVLYIKKVDVPMKHARGNLLSYSFHRTELYRVPMQDISTASVLKFVLEDYAYIEHLNVPKEHTEVHSQIDQVFDALKSIVEEYTRAHTIHAGLLIILLTMVLAVIFFLVKKFTKKKIL